MADIAHALENTTHEWQGYTYKKGERGMYWVSKNGINPMPGACCFATPEDAQRGIAALVVANAICPPLLQGGAPLNSDVFWSLLELSKQRAAV